MTLNIKEVSGAKGRRAFLDVTRHLYKNDPHFVQPLAFEKNDSLNPLKNPFFEHATLALFVAYLDGRAVGRISAVYDELAQEKWGPDLGYFGFFEASDETVAHALLDRASGWLRDKGAKTLQGPWSLNPKEECGLLIKGFDTPPCFLMPHGKPTYATWLESYGLAKAHDLYAYQVDLTTPWPEKARRIMDMGAAMKKLTLREIDMKRFDQEVELMVDIVADAWADNWGFTPFTKAEGAHLAKSLKMLIKPHRTVFTELNGEAVGFMVTLPDLNDDIKDFNGKLLPFNIFKFLKRRILTKQDAKRMRVPLMGVRKSVQKGRIGAAAALWMIDYSSANVIKRGSVWGELGWILDSNEGMNSILSEIGSDRYKTYRIYEKVII